MAIEWIGAEEQNMSVPRDPRWVLLFESGDYAIFGRHREPDDDVIKGAEDALGRSGLAGWLAVMSHSEHLQTPPEFVMVRPLGNPQSAFAQAVESFARRRRTS